MLRMLWRGWKRRHSRLYTGTQAQTPDKDKSSIYWAAAPVLDPSGLRRVRLNIRTGGRM